ncbi:hypothetical protein ID866_8589 [Astraeus odoratus]|nr:hypothetical protein ID866_8589 [Astraeus odoratus]
MSDVVEKITFDLAEGSEPALKELTRLASRFSINLNGHIQLGEGDELPKGTTTVYTGTFLPDGIRVAMKTIARGRSRGSLLAVKKNIRDIQAWTKLHHENILPVLGITTEFDSSVALVSEWIGKRSAHDYVQDESVDPRPVIVEIALGLQYLHNHTPSPIFHGDLMGVCFFHSGVHP